MFGGSNQVFGCLGLGCHHGVVVVSCLFFSGDEAARSQDTSECEKKHRENCHWTYAPRKINIEPENGGLEDDFSFPGVYSQVPF